MINRFRVSSSASRRRRIKKITTVVYEINSFSISE